MDGNWLGSTNNIITLFFAQEAAELLKDGIDLITDADAALSNLLSYPLHATLSRSAEMWCFKFNPSGTLH